MKIVEFGAADGYASTQYGSSGFTVTPVAKLSGQAVCLRLDAEGVIGRHRASGRQVFAVVAGAGTVSGDDGELIPITAGQAAVWEPGEQHETRSVDGLTAIVLEGVPVEVLLPRTKR